MYDLNDLEKKWVEYKKQKYRKIVYLGSAFAAVSAISFGVAYLIFSKPQTSVTESLEQPPKDLNVATAKEINVSAVLEESHGSGASPREIVIISPQDAQNDFSTYQPAPTQQQPIERAPETKKIDPPAPKPEPQINIETKTADRIDILASRYKKSPDAQTAVELSEIFYKRENYPKALKWAINSNNLDPKNERSWILFAKASYKLGKKNDAINALENFVNSTNSEAARSALTQMKKDEL